MTYINDFILLQTGEDIVIEGNKLSYRSGFFKFRRIYNILAHVDKGSFHLEFNDEGCRLNYEFSMYRLFVISFFLSLLVGAFYLHLLMALIFFAIMLFPAWLVAIIRHRLMLSEIILDIEILIIEKKEKENSFLQSGDLDYRLPGAVDWTPEDGEWKREGGDWTPELKEETDSPDR
jgi:hypothetical protein